MPIFSWISVFVSTECKKCNKNDPSGQKKNHDEDIRMDNANGRWNITKTRKCVELKITQQNMSIFFAIFKEKTCTYFFDVSLSVKKDDDRNKHKLSMDYYYA